MQTLRNDYEGVIVPKAWGYEWCCFDNGKAAIWVLHIARKRKTSLHCHPNKRTRLIVLSGQVRFTDDNGTRTLKPMDIATIEKGVYHQTEAFLDSDIYPPCEDGAWVMEIEEPSMKHDLVRAKDEYGREGKPYETDVVPYAGELLSLSTKPHRFMGYEFCVSPTLFYGIHTSVPFGDGDTLCIRKDQTMKVSDYVADFIASLGIRHVFSVSGGGSMHLVDSVGRHEKLKYVAMHHEQAAAMAAESYARLNGIGCALVTTGPGGTNAITGVACAWVDSIPVLYISGQVTRDTLIADTGVRQFGVQESNIVEMVKSITKYAVTVKDENEIRRVMEKAAFIARDGRPGPVWVDIPLDIQSRQIKPRELRKYDPPQWPKEVLTQYPNPQLSEKAEECLLRLRYARRPVLIVGNGARGAEKEIRKLIGRLNIPVISSWTAFDMVGDLPEHIGHCGIFGDRAGNFAVQNADLLLVIGCRLSVPMIGYNFKHFAREAKIIMVDADENEIGKPSLRVDLPIVADAKEFVAHLLARKPQRGVQTWDSQCRSWREKYPVVLPEYATEKQVNSYYFIDELCKQLPEDAVVVTDMGTAFTGTFQAAKLKYGQRWTTASGHAPMGYGLPGAIGAHYATGKKVVCIVGDGALQFNIQELATIAHNKLPIVIFVLNNGGYLTIKHMQANHFGKMVGSDEGSGVWCPDAAKIGAANGIEWALEISETEYVGTGIRAALEVPAPCVAEVKMSATQPLIPRLASKKLPDGSIKSTPLEDLYPFLPREEFAANMTVKPAETLE